MLNTAGTISLDLVLLHPALVSYYVIGDLHVGLVIDQSSSYMKVTIIKCVRLWEGLVSSNSPIGERLQLQGFKSILYHL